MSLQVLRGAYVPTSRRPISHYLFPVADDQGEIGHITGDNIELELNANGFHIFKDPEVSSPDVVDKKQDILMDVQLVTSDEKPVATVQIIRFDDPPKVITWGIRFFAFEAADKYKEVFSVAAIVTKEKT